MLSSLDDGRLLAVVRDTTAAKNMSARLTQLAYCDALTGLPNRAALYRVLDGFFNADGDRTIRPMSIALFDLDGFKEVNDTMGHSAGDRLLKEVADRWLAVIGSGPQIFRLGGDEFILLVAIAATPGALQKSSRQCCSSLKRRSTSPGQRPSSMPVLASQSLPRTAPMPRN
jgi:diguanylate cyclase (GGDEF)-like protein